MASYKTYSDVKGKYYYVDYRGNTLDLADAIEPKVHDSAAFTNYYKGGPDFQSINADQPTKYYNNFAGFGYKSTDGDIGAAPARGYYPTVDLTDGDYPSNFWSSAFDSAGKTITITRTDSQLTVGSSVFKPEIRKFFNVSFPCTKYELKPLLKVVTLSKETTLPRYSSGLSNN